MQLQNKVQNTTFFFFFLNYSFKNPYTTRNTKAYRNRKAESISCVLFHFF